MKILWCDDKAGDAKEIDAFVKDWKLEDRRGDILAATSDREALALLHTHRDIGLLIIDLLWEGQPSTLPSGQSASITWKTFESFILTFVSRREV